MEAILDIVLNHNGESDEFGPTLSFRGLDNATYFRLLPDDRSRYVNDIGCGNCLALDRPAVADMALSALRRWMTSAGSTVFASISPRRLGGASGASIRMRRCFRRSKTIPSYQSEADRRTVGHRSGRLSTRRVSRELGRMERSLSRQRASLLARRRRAPRGNRDAACGLADIFRPPPPPQNPSTSSSRTTASRSTISSPTAQAQRGERRE